MRKQRNKMKKLNKRKVVSIVAIQVFIVIIFSLILYSTTTTPIEKTKVASIVVEDIECIGGRKPFLSISSGPETYIIDNSAYPDEYSVKQLEKMISIGDSISIRYERRFSVRLGIHNNIVDARTDTHVYRSLEMINESRIPARKSGCILTGGIEFVFLFIVIAMVISKSIYL